MLELAKFIIIDCCGKPYRYLALSSFLVHFNKLDLDLVISAYYLDPNQRMRYLTMESLELAEIYITKLFYDMGFSDDEGLVLKRDFNRYKLQVSKLDGSIDLLFDWWEESQLTMLKMMGMRFAACHASSANTERIFSALGRIYRPDRNRSALKTAFDLLTIQLANQSAPKPTDNDHRSPSTSSASIDTQALEDGHILDGVDDYEGSHLSLEAILFDLGIYDEAGIVQENLDVLDSPANDRFRARIDFNARIEVMVEEETNEPQLSSEERARRLFGR